MKNFKDILLEKLKVTTKHIGMLSFTFSDLYNSIVRFTKKNAHGETALKRGTQYIVYIFELDYFKDNPLIITDENPIDSSFKPLKGCKIGVMIVNTKTPGHIQCFTSERRTTLNNDYEPDIQFYITEENFSQIFDTDALEILYEILNEEN